MKVVGIDEVGRGCWAGPLVAAAVVLPEDFSLAGSKLQLCDSKKLSKSQREKLDVIIREQALAFGIGWAWPADIDISGITTAVKTAMAAALEQIEVAYDEVIVDGNINFLSEVPTSRAVIKADDISPAVSAASIVAKVARDTYMAELAATYPDYGFDTHVGYGTAAHIAALKAHGVTDIHRRSYKPIRALLELK